MSSKFDVLVLTLLDDGSSVNWSEHGIDAVQEVLNENGLSVFNGELNGLDDLWVGESGDLEFVVSLLLFQPLDTLKLWVNNQGVSLRVSKNSTILSRHLIRWQFLIVPLGDFGIISQNNEWVSSWTVRNVILLEESNEVVLHNHVSVFLVEWTYIGYEG